MSSFSSLWRAHPTVTGEKPVLDRSAYPDQCAINLSAALMRCGIDLASFHGTRSWQKDAPRYPIRAQELADWLAKGGLRTAARTQKLPALEALGRVEGKRGLTGRTGIVFFRHYWGSNMQGNHIDLWNGSRLTDRMSWSRINLRVGNWGLHSLGMGSDFVKAESVWFWAIG